MYSPIIARMEWYLVISAWALMSAGVVTAGLYLRGPRAAEVGSKLQGLLRGGGPDRRYVSAFLVVFDRLFSGRVQKGPTLPLEKTLWVGVILAPAIVFILRFGTWIVGRSQPSKLNLLLIAISIAFVYSIVLWAWLQLPRRIKTFDIVPATLFVVVPLVGLPLVFVSIGFVDSLPVWRLTVVGLGVFYVNGLVWVVGVLIAPFRQGDGFRQFPIHLGKAIAASAFFTAVVGLIQWDATKSFFDVVATDGPVAVTFVAYNVFADGISLIKTRWLLERSATAGVKTLVGLLGLDLLLSAAVFILPTTMWELPTFWDAIIFRGDRPWLGVLFWTTLSTSALFYLFVLAAVLAGPVSRVSRAVRLKLDPESEPVLALTAALVVGVTAAFLFGAGITAIVVRDG